MDGPAAVVFGHLGLSLQPHFNPPWEAASISQFWGRQVGRGAAWVCTTFVPQPAALCGFLLLGQLASSSPGHGMPWQAPTHMLAAKAAH